jgi:hypothetical protein
MGFFKKIKKAIKKIGKVVAPGWRAGNQEIIQQEAPPPPPPHA